MKACLDNHKGQIIKPMNLFYQGKAILPRKLDKKIFAKLSLEKSSSYLTFYSCSKDRTYVEIERIRTVPYWKFQKQNQNQNQMLLNSKRYLVTPNIHKNIYIVNLNSLLNKKL